MTACGISLATLCLGACATNENAIRDHIHSWQGQNESAVTGTFGFPQQTIDMAGGSKVYHYSFNKHCTIDFEIDSKQVVSDVKPTGSDLGDCPRKLPGGGSY